MERSVERRKELGKLLEVAPGGPWKWGIGGGPSDGPLIVVELGQGAATGRRECRGLSVG